MSLVRALGSRNTQGAGLADRAVGAVFTMSKRERPEAGADGGVVQFPRYTGGQQEVVPEPRRGRSANQQHGEPAAKRGCGEETLAAAAAAAAAATTTTAAAAAHAAGKDQMDDEGDEGDDDEGDDDDDEEGEGEGEGEGDEDDGGENEAKEQDDDPAAYKVAILDSMLSELCAPCSPKAIKANKGFCKFEGGCNKRSQYGGLCIAHGGVRERKPCQHESGCKKWALGKSGVCITHGAAVKRRLCQHEGCPLTSRKGGMCAAHGGGGAMCKSKTCTKLPLKGGFCVAHGGIYQRCKFEGGCEKWAAKAGLCKGHGGTKPRTMCKQPGGCIKVAKKDGLCLAHRTALIRCKYAPGCKKNAQWKGGFCITHWRALPKCSWPGGCETAVPVEGYCATHDGVAAMLALK